MRSTPVIPTIETGPCSTQDGWYTPLTISSTIPYEYGRPVEHRVIPSVPEKSELVNNSHLDTHPASKLQQSSQIYSPIHSILAFHDAVRNGLSNHSHWRLYDRIDLARPDYLSDRKIIAPLSF